MERIQIDAAGLGTQTFRMELEGKDGAVNRVELAPSGGLTGGYAQGAEEIGLNQIKAEELALTALRWNLPEGVIELAAPGRLLDAEIDAAIAIGEGAQREGGPFRGVIHARAVEVSLLVRLDKVTFRVHGLELDGVTFEVRDDGALRLAAREASAERIEVELEAMNLYARSITLSEGLGVEGGGVRLPHLATGELEIGLTDLAALGSSSGRERAGGEEGPAATAPAGDPPEPAAAREPLELPFLDHLDGKIDADVTTDVTVPILGRRRATHRFRIAVEQGVIDFRALEGNLAFLEDMVLHFRLRDDRLVLEKDVPFLPFDRKPLVFWALSPEEQELARGKRVRLRSLLRPELPPKQKKEIEEHVKKRGKGVELRRLDIGSVDVALRVGGPSRLAVAGGSVLLGVSPEKPAVGALELQGTISHDAQGGDGPGGLSLGLRQLEAGLERLVAGAHLLDAERIEIGSIEKAQLSFHGLTPRSLQARVSGFALLGLTLSPLP